MQFSWYATIIYLTKQAFRPFGGISAQGTQNIPTDGPIILAPNHLSYFDPPAVACTATRQLHIMAKKELFEVPLFGPFIRSVGAFPVQRGRNDIEAIRKAQAVLLEGKALLLFPEGTRGDGQTLLPMSPGIGMLAKRTKARVVPVGIIGTHRIFPKDAKKIQKAKAQVLFGAPFTYEDVAHGQTEQEKRESFIMKLEESIAALCQEGGLPLKTPHRTGFSETLLV